MQSRRADSHKTTLPISVLPNVLRRRIAVEIAPLDANVHHRVIGERPSNLSYVAFRYAIGIGWLRDQCSSFQVGELHHDLVFGKIEVLVQERQAVFLFQSVADQDFPKLDESGGFGLSRGSTSWMSFCLLTANASGVADRLI